MVNEINSIGLAPLTPECFNCQHWADGSNPERGFGCACNFPIKYCPHYAAGLEN